MLNALTVARLRVQIPEPYMSLVPMSPHPDYCRYAAVKEQVAAGAPITGLLPAKTFSQVPARVGRRQQRERSPVLCPLLAGLACCAS